MLSQRFARQPPIATPGGGHERPSKMCEQTSTQADTLCEANGDDERETSTAVLELIFSRMCPAAHAVVKQNLARATEKLHDIMVVVVRCDTVAGGCLPPKHRQMHFCEVRHNRHDYRSDCRRRKRIAC